MFIVAVTKNDQDVRRPGLDYTVFRHGAWKITVGARSDMVQLTNYDAGFNLVESPLVSVSQGQKLPVAMVEFQRSKMELRITKPLGSGKPLYFHRNAAGEFFCSTHFAQLRAFGVRLEADETVIPEFLLYRYLVPPATLYKSVSQVPLGATLRVGLTQENSEIGKLEYWFPAEAGPNAPSEELAEEMTRLLAARLQKLAPVQSQIAVLLSGGLDSTTLFRTAQRLFGINESYSTGFPFEENHENTERHYAESAAHALRSRHHYYQSGSHEYLPGVLSAIVAAEEPVHHLQSVLLWLLFKRGLPPDQSIVLSGEGADGILGVELQRRFWRKEHRGILFTLLAQPPLNTIIRWFTNATKRGRGFFEPIMEPMAGKDYENPNHELWSLGCYGDVQWVLKSFGCRREDLFRSRLELVNRIKERSIYDIISILALMGEGTITQCIWSKIGEACGRFLDYPFVDPNLLSFAFRTSWEEKLREPKMLVRGALRQMGVPEFIIRRPKSSFGLKRRGWAMRDGLFEPLVALTGNVFPEESLRSLQTDSPSDGSTFWAVLNYALWKRLCVNGEPLESLQDELKWQVKATPLSDSNRAQQAFNDSPLQNVSCR